MSTGLRGRTLVVPKAVRERMETLTPILSHAIKMLRRKEVQANTNNHVSVLRGSGGARDANGRCQAVVRGGRRWLK